MPLNKFTTTQEAETESQPLVTESEFIANAEQEPSEGYEVLAEAATNNDTTVEMLGALARSESEYVRSKVAENEKTPTLVLDTLLHDSVLVRVSLAKNPNVIERVWSLVRDESTIVRLHLAANPYLPDHVYQVLTKDTDSNVAWRARRTLRAVRRSDNPVVNLFSLFHKAS